MLPERTAVPVCYVGGGELGLGVAQLGGGGQVQVVAAVRHTRLVTPNLGYFTLSATNGVKYGTSLLLNCYFIYYHHYHYYYYHPHHFRSNINILSYQLPGVGVWTDGRAGVPVAEGRAEPLRLPAQPAQHPLHLPSAVRCGAVQSSSTSPLSSLANVFSQL